MMYEGGPVYPEMTSIPKDHLDQLKKVLKWVKDNPGIHPENIKTELRNLEKLFGV
ncbi:hypothetical protein Xoosp13_90 [Xanthomonas phage Xoo-sp13]|nr:hypothetical protein Xoosp13_90 [Xanthomonas phage Xoo-sp13]